MRKSEMERRLMQDDGPVYLTRAGIEKMKRTIKRIEADLPAMREEVARTQAMGDLSENAAYQEAKWRLRRNSTRKLVLEERLKQAVEIPEGGSIIIQLGSSVTLEKSDGSTVTYHIVGPREADPLKGRLSHKSPLGAQLIGASEGETITAELPNGPMVYTIKQVS